MVHTRSRWKQVAPYLIVFLAAKAGLAFVPPSDDVTVAVDADDLEAFAGLSLEELMTIEVTSLSGFGQEWFRTPAAMYVITGEEIRRSGHRSIAEALRLAPGVFVGRSNSHTWSVGMRGFNGGLSTKTLVLIDGRSVYDPLLSGTYWDVQDTLLEDIDRIEVIRGPGATLWGANAVNGVINIITKDARDTQGLFAEAGAGTFERAFGSVRYGMAVADNAWLRIYTKYADHDSFESETDDNVGDDWNMTQAGFRFDLEGTDEIWITLQGDFYYSDRIGENLDDGAVDGGNVLFRISQEVSETAGWSLQTYYARADRTFPLNSLEVNRDTFDIDFRHHFQLAENHAVVWGLGFRSTSDDTSGNPLLTFDPEARTLRRYSAFIQDTVTLVPDRLFAMAGVKFLDDTYSGFEYQPSGRIWWTPDDRQMVWGSASRAVRTPSRFESDLEVIVPGISLLGNDSLQSEELLALELGYRRKLTETLTLDVAVYYNEYDDLIFLPLSTPFLFNNDGSAESYGTEIAVAWQAAENWRLDASYTFTDVFVHGPIINSDEASTPHHMVKLQSYLDITENLEFNGGLSYIDEVPLQAVGDYWRLDLGFTWRPTPNFELSVWGQNLLDPQHPEFSALESPRGFYVRGSIRF